MLCIILQLFLSKQVKQNNYTWKIPTLTKQNQLPWKGQDWLWVTSLSKRDWSTTVYLEWLCHSVTKGNECVMLGEECQGQQLPGGFWDHWPTLAFCWHWQLGNILVLKASLLFPHGTTHVTEFLFLAHHHFLHVIFFSSLAFILINLLSILLSIYTHYFKWGAF